MKAEDIQIGGEHYKSFAVQPFVLCNSFTGPAAHILTYVIRKKCPHDLAKALHWCDLALSCGMQGVFSELVMKEEKEPEDPEDEFLPEPEEPRLITAMEWLWVNKIPADSPKANVILCLEKGDFLLAKIHIELMVEEQMYTGEKD